MLAANLDDGNNRRVITGTQIRMARTALRWSTRELAAKAATGASTISRAEASPGVPSVNARVLLRITQALEQAGAEFLPDGSVRVRT
jgi:transcriptional regulator with XRE-family HTH domain